MWRVLVGLHEEITLLFLPVGHTKFSPDWCFGLLKKKFRRSVVSSLDELARVVDHSADVNTSQLVGTHDGEVVVPTYDWAGYLGGVFRKIKGIKKYHSFRFSAASLGIVFMKKMSEPEEQCNIAPKRQFIYVYYELTTNCTVEPGTAVVLVQQYSAISYS